MPMNTKPDVTFYNRLILFTLVALAGAVVWTIVALRTSPVQRPGTDPEAGASVQEANADQGPPETEHGIARALADRYGIEITSMDVAVNGTLLAFRYKVLDPALANQLARWEHAACILDSSGRVLSKPNVPETVRLRQDSGQALRAGRVYSFLFPNPGQSVKPGDRVTLVIGNLRARDLLVR